MCAWDVLSSSMCVCEVSEELDRLFHQLLHHICINTHTHTHIYTTHRKKIILKNQSKLRLVVSPTLVTLEWLSPIIWQQEASGSPVHLVPSYTGSWWGDCIFVSQLYLITVGAASAITGIKFDCPYFPVYYGATLDIVLIFSCSFIFHLHTLYFAFIWVTPRG